MPALRSFETIRRSAAEYIRAQLDLDTRDESGVTKRQHLEHVEAHTGRQQYDLPPLPPAAQSLVEILMSMRGLRVETWSDMESWLRLTGRHLAPECVSILALCVEDARGA